MKHSSADTSVRTIKNWEQYGFAEINHANRLLMIYIDDLWGIDYRNFIKTKKITYNDYAGGSDCASILSEAERGEDAIKKAYQEALANGDLPVNATEMIRSQARVINTAHDQIKGLRDAAKA